MALAAAPLGTGSPVCVRTGAGILGGERLRARYALRGGIGEHSAVLAGAGILLVQHDPAAVPGDLPMESGCGAGAFAADRAARRQTTGRIDGVQARAGGFI